MAEKGRVRQLLSRIQEIQCRADESRRKCADLMRLCVRSAVELSEVVRSGNDGQIDEALRNLAVATDAALQEHRERRLYVEILRALEDK